MILNFIKRSIILLCVIIPLLIIAFNGCSQYDYSSPTPGTLEVRLHSYYTQFDTVFADNNFTLKVTRVYAVRSDGILANVYEDVKAVGPTPDIYNILGRDAYDSLLVIGLYPLPPADYLGLIVQIEPGPSVVLDGYRNIAVDRLPPPDYTTVVNIFAPFHIEEAKTTSLVITADMDVTLKRLAYTFQYNPSYFVSSQKTY